MRKRYWNRKVSALLMAGLMLSALPVHAFAEEEQGKTGIVQAEQEVGEEKEASPNGEDNAFGTQDGLVSAEEASELKGTEVDTENQGDAGKDADTNMNTDKDADTDIETGEGKETETEENTANASTEKAEAASEVKPEAEEELAEETLSEELTLASASNIPMTDTAAETEASLLGTWTVDNYTSLAFYGDGKGAMLLPTESYDFHYTLNDDQLELDFVSSHARDLSYTISLDAETLQLNSGTGTNTVAITLQRAE